MLSVIASPEALRPQSAESNRRIKACTSTIARVLVEGESLPEPSWEQAVGCVAIDAVTKRPGQGEASRAREAGRRMRSVRRTWIASTGGDERTDER